MISKFVESIDGYGRVSNRVVYALDSASLPAPKPLAQWRQDHTFNETEALANDRQLSRVFDWVRRHGFTWVIRLV
jgi:hypothetical protein